MVRVKDSDLQHLSSLHVRDIIWLVAVIMKVKPMSTLVVPLEAKGWFKGFYENYNLVEAKDHTSDSHQTSITVCRDERTAELRNELEEIHSIIDEGKRNPISPAGSIYDRFSKALTRIEGVAYGYPECCVEFHAEHGPSSRARAYEQFLESGRDQSIPIEFWAVAHAPCSSTCHKTLELGRKYLNAVAEFSTSLRNNVEARLLLPRFYQTGGGRFIEIQPLDYECGGVVAVSMDQFEKDARQRLPEGIEIILCEVPRPYALVDASEGPTYKTAFPNPDMIGTMWIAYSPGFGAYMVNARTGELALYTSSDRWIPKVGEEWRSKSNFRIYKSVQ